MKKEDEETVKKLDRHVKKIKLKMRINPKIIAEWEADGGALGTYKTPEEYFRAYYGDPEEF